MLSQGSRVALATPPSRGSRRLWEMPSLLTCPESNRAMLLWFFRNTVPASILKRAPSSSAGRERVGVEAAGPKLRLFSPRASALSARLGPHSLQECVALKSPTCTLPPWLLLGYKRSLLK